MKFTGERYIPEVNGEIQFEHLNRYFSCLDIVSGKEVLDIACGEGYGSRILAKVAMSVIGVDIDPEAITHARVKYQFQENLTFLEGTCSAIPLADKSVDIVTSFETIEHHDQHDEMMQEISRVLRDDGLMIISSPNRLVYSDQSNYSNPFHVKELYYQEFVDLLRKYFQSITIYGQKLEAASFIYPLENSSKTLTDSHIGKFYTSLDSELHAFSLDSPVYYVAICSNSVNSSSINHTSVFIEAKTNLWNSTRLHIINLQSQLEQTQAQLEQTQLYKLDASFEALSGISLPKKTINVTKDLFTKLIAFYLPQYHRIPENSEWWSPGFTEWTNVVKGQPNYNGHYQPHLPRELGFYDLSNVEIMREQAEIAKLYGINAFCFYYYWFSGETLLKKPIDNFLNSNIDFEYCLCWANENWTRTWDGDTKSILIEQKYLDTDPKDFIQSLLPYFHDTRYIRVDGKPMLVVYRAKDIQNASQVFSIWRNVVVAHGFAGLHISVVDFYDISHPNEVDADALIEFPPHKFNSPQSVPDQMPSITNENFKGAIVDYAKVIAQSANRQQPDFTLYRGIVPSWDNTARRQDTPTILHGSSPDLFKAWLSYLRAYNRATFKDKVDSFIFINAWNEWGEGCHLEPDHKWGLSYLEAVKSSSWYNPEMTLESQRYRLLQIATNSVLEREESSKIDNASKKQNHVKVLQELQSLLPPSKESMAHDKKIGKIANFLSSYPIIYYIGKKLYKVYRNIQKGQR